MENYTAMHTIGRDLLGELMLALDGEGLHRGIFYEIEDYFNFGCSYAVNKSGLPNVGVRCPWGGGDEGFAKGWAKQYVKKTLIPELKDLVTRYHPVRRSQMLLLALSLLLALTIRCAGLPVRRRRLERQRRLPANQAVPGVAVQRVSFEEECRDQRSLGQHHADASRRLLHVRVRPELQV